MSRYASRGAVCGVLQRRLLVNAVVDPDEAAARLPARLRPHETPLGTVIGCCLLDIGELRPQRLPAAVSMRQRAAAHRISVEWEDETGATVVGVWVPARRTDAQLAVVLGGRWFPGVHRRAHVSLDVEPERLSWRVDDGKDFVIDVTASVPTSGARAARDDVVAGTCLSATLGVSADHGSRLEAARMVTETPDARAVNIERLSSRFIEGFRTAQWAPSYLMEKVGVTWSPAAGPWGVGTERVP